MAKGTDVTMEEITLAHEGFLRRRPVSTRASRPRSLVSNGSMPGHRGFDEGWSAKWQAPALDSDPSGMAAERALSPLAGLVTMNGVSFGKMPPIGLSLEKPTLT